MKNQLIFSLVTLVSGVFFTSCNTKSVPGYDRLKAAGVVDTCMVLGHAAVPTHFFGNPDVSTISKKGDGTMIWSYEKNTQSLYQKPIYVDTETNIGNPYQTGLNRNMYTVPITTTTTVSGGGIGITNHRNAYRLIVNVKNFQITNYSYSEHGFGHIPYSDKSADFISILHVACRTGDIERFQMNVKSGFVQDSDNIIRCAIEAAKYDQDEMLKYLMDTYPIDIDKKVKTYIITDGACHDGGSILLRQNAPLDDAIYGRSCRVSKKACLLSVREAAQISKSTDVLTMLQEREKLNQPQ